MRQTTITLHTRQVRLHDDYPVYVGYVKVTHYTDSNKTSYNINQEHPVMRLTRKDAKLDAQALKDDML